jgi:hypothetical protein
MSINPDEINLHHHREFHQCRGARACIKEDNIMGISGTRVVYRAVKKLWLTAGCPEEAATVNGHKEKEVGSKFVGKLKLLSRLRHYNILCMLEI